MEGMMTLLIMRRFLLLQGCSVELQGTLTRGMMVLEKRNRNDVEMLQSSTSVEVIKEVHVEMFKELVLDLLGTKFD